MSKAKRNSLTVDQTSWQIGLVVLGIIVLLAAYQLKNTFYTLQTLVLLVVYVFLGKSVLSRTTNATLSLLLMIMLGVLFFVFLLIT